MKVGLCLLWVFLETCCISCTEPGIAKETEVQDGEAGRREDTCPCAQLPGSAQCRPYDPHYQALTIEEAVLHFVDPTNPQEQKAMLGDAPQHPKDDKPACTTRECACCSLLVLEKIRQSLGPQAGIKDKSTTLLLNTTEQSLKKRYGKAINCWKYLDQCHIDKDIKVFNSPKIKMQKPRTPKRFVRQASLGSSTQLSCNYRRGDTLNDGSGYVGLCNLCWSIRTLPSNYFPRFINELTCDRDTKCLSGWGTCRERTRSVDVMVNSGSEAFPTWSTVSINSPVACECQILSGSALHNLAMA